MIVYTLYDDNTRAPALRCNDNQLTYTFGSIGDCPNQTVNNAAAPYRAAIVS